MSDLPPWSAVLIVKNEAAGIERCLSAAAAAGVAVVTLLDTGSTDATLDIARAVADRTGLDLRVHHTTFVDFGQARSEAFALAHGTARWIVALDADMALEIDEGFEPDAGLDCLMVEMGKWTPFSYRLPLVLKGSVEFVSVGAVHEFTRRADGRPYRSQSTDAVRIDMTAADRGSPEKYRWHLGMLLAAYRKDRANERTVYYIGQTYATLGDARRARRWFLRRAAMGGFDEERYYAAYRAALLAPDWPTRSAELLAAWEMRPQRLEALYDFCREANSRDLHHLVYRLTSEPTPPCADILFVGREAWDWGLAFERSIAAWWVGWRDEAYEIGERLLTNPNLPPHIRAQVIANLAYREEAA